MDTEEWQLMQRHFSPERLSPFLAEANQDKKRAKALYLWDAQARASLLTPLGHLEVAIRNALDRQMSLRQQNLGISTHWVFDEAHQLGRNARGEDQHRAPYTDIVAAMRHVKSNHKALEPAQVISELPFGFWHQLVSKRQNFLWPDIAGAFPYAPSRTAQPIRDRFAQLRSLRNRIGHHHRIGGIGLSARYDDLLTLAGYIDLELSRWIDEHSTVQNVLLSKP